MMLLLEAWKIYPYSKDSGNFCDVPQDWSKILHKKASDVRSKQIKINIEICRHIWRERCSSKAYTCLTKNLTIPSFEELNNINKFRFIRIQMKFTYIGSVEKKR